MENIILPDEYIDGLSGQEVIDLVTRNFSLSSIQDLQTLFAIDHISLDNRVLVIEDIQTFQAQLYDVLAFTQRFSDLSRREEKLAMLETVYGGTNNGKEIVVYNQDYIFEIKTLELGNTIQQAEIEYMEGVPSDKVVQLYKQTILSHEIAHSIFAQKLCASADMLSEWLTLVVAHPSVSKYADAYKADIGQGADFMLYLNESFAESVRIYSCNPYYLQKTFPAIYAFIGKYFPYIQPLYTGGNNPENNIKSKNPKKLSSIGGYPKVDTLLFSGEVVPKPCSCGHYQATSTKGVIMPECKHCGGSSPLENLKY